MWTGRDFAKVKLVERSYAYGQRPMDETDEYYSNMDHLGQHPWYTNSMIVMMIVLVAAIICYSGNALFTWYSGNALFTWICSKRASLIFIKPTSHETQCIANNIPRDLNTDASPQT